MLQTQQGHDQVQGKALGGKAVYLKNFWYLDLIIDLGSILARTHTIKLQHNLNVA